MARMISSRTQFTGLTKLITGMSKAAGDTDGALYDMTDELGAQHLQIYKDNLNGLVASTADDPLPVGVRTGDLLASARLEGNAGSSVNQHAYRLINTAPQSGFIEEGTQNMAPRRPLQDSIDKMAEKFQTAIGNAMTRILGNVDSASDEPASIGGED